MPEHRITCGRFWIRYKEDWVKITVRENHPVNVFEGGQTEEGWFRSIETYYFTEEGIMMEWDSSEQDCDGRLDRGGQLFCPFNQLQSYFPDDEAHDAPFDAIPTPNWKKLEQRQRDHAAEAMNY